MNEEQIVLARRAMACHGWKWMPGMLGWRPDNHGVPHSIRFLEGVESMEALAGVGTGPLIASGYAICDGYWKSDDITPDLTDPATLGCLLALVRETWGNPTGFVVPGRDGNWMYYTQLFGADYWTGGSEAEALVAALEAAPSAASVAQ